MSKKPKEPRIETPAVTPFLIDYTRAIGYVSKQLLNLNSSKIKSELKSYNSILISAQKQEEDIWIETTRFKLTGKISFPKELDSMVYLIEHFFHKMKRDKLIED